MRRKFNPFGFFEPTLSQRKELVPVMIESRARVWLSCAGEKQGIAVVEIFQPLAPLWIILRTLGPNVAKQRALKTGGKVNGLFLPPTAPFVFYERLTSMLSSPVAPHSHLKHLAESRAGLSNEQ